MGGRPTPDPGEWSSKGLVQKHCREHFARTPMLGTLFPSSESPTSPSCSTCGTFPLTPERSLGSRETPAPSSLVTTLWEALFSVLHFRAAEGKVEICWYYFKMFLLSSLFIFTHTVIVHRKKTRWFFCNPKRSWTAFILVDLTISSVKSLWVKYYKMQFPIANKQRLVNVISYNWQFNEFYS